MMHSSETLRKQIDQSRIEIGRAKVSTIARRARAIERLIGMADCAEQWERDIEHMEAYAAEHDWPAARRVLVRWRLFAKLAVYVTDHESEMYTRGWTEQLREIRYHLDNTQADDDLLFS